MKNSGIKLTIVLSLLAALAAPALARTGGDKVLNLIAMNNGVVIFTGNVNRQGVPSCASNYPYRLGANGSTPAGQALVAAILSAQATGKNLSITGTGDCSQWSDSESIQYIMLTDK